MRWAVMKCGGWLRQGHMERRIVVGKYHAQRLPAVLDIRDGGGSEVATFANRNKNKVCTPALPSFLERSLVLASRIHDVFAQIRLCANIRFLSRNCTPCGKYTKPPFVTTARGQMNGTLSSHTIRGALNNTSPYVGRPLNCLNCGESERENKSLWGDVRDSHPRRAVSRW